MVVVIVKIGTERLSVNIDNVLLVLSSAPSRLCAHSSELCRASRPRCENLLHVRCL